MPIFKPLVRLGLVKKKKKAKKQKSKKKQTKKTTKKITPTAGIEPRSAAVVADALATRPKRLSKESRDWCLNLPLYRRDRDALPLHWARQAVNTVET